MANDNVKVIARNRKARHNYHIEDTLEAGLVLTGSEIKSIRAGSVDIAEGYINIQGREMWAHNLYIAPFEQAADNNHETRRPRKLLLHRYQISRWGDNVQQKGYTIVPLSLYLRGHLAKLEIGLARGKRQYDKRQDIAKRDAQRRIDRALSERGRG
ncbi:MAG: SsrA-binding protein SmpB [Chloroflexi bacterium]|nr:SsrA-binding protein SmpB [Chloroflexota bacterium]